MTRTTFKLKVGLFCLINIPLFCHSKVTAATHEEIEALSLIDSALNSERTLQCYTTISYQIKDNRPITIKEYIRVEPDHSRLMRIEHVLTQNDNTFATNVYINNRDGAWLIYRNSIEQLSQVPQFHRTVPRRLSTANVLGLADIPKYSLERHLDYFGRKAAKITVALSDKTIAWLTNNQELFKDLLRNEYLTGAMPRVNTSTESNWRAIAELQFPVIYIYYIDETTPFVLSWQAFSFTGQKTYDVSFQEISFPETLPDALFDVKPSTASGGPGGQISDMNKASH